MKLRLEVFGQAARTGIATYRRCLQLILSICFLSAASGCAGTIASVPGSSSSPTGPVAPSVVDAIVVFGDSLTCGGQGNSYGQSPIGSVPDALQSMLDIPAVNQGVGGNTSSQIDVRYNAGGAHQTVTLAGNQIPVSGSVQATFPSGWQPVTSSGGNNGAACYQSLTGQGTNATINGVAGVFTYAGGNYSFTPTVYPPSPVTTVVNNPYTVATPYAGYFLVDSSGTNDVNQNVPLATVIANDKAMAALAGNRFIVASALPFDLPSYMPGGTAAISLANLNAAKASTFGNHYADTLTPLLDGCGPVPGGALAAMDALDIANGIVPTSCRAYNGSKIAANINSTQTTVCLSGAYPAVGEKGYFSHVTDPVGGFEAFLITAIVTPGTCSTGSQMTVVRGYAGTVAGTYLANQDSWGFWDRVHLSGGAPNTAVAAKTGYAIQAEAIAEAYRILTESAAP